MCSKYRNDILLSVDMTLTGNIGITGGGGGAQEPRLRQCFNNEFNIWNLTLKLHRKNSLKLEHNHVCLLETLVSQGRAAAETVQFIGVTGNVSITYLTFEHECHLRLKLHTKFTETQTQSSMPFRNTGRGSAAAETVQLIGVKLWYHELNIWTCMPFVIESAHNHVCLLETLVSRDTGVGDCWVHWRQVVVSSDNNQFNIWTCMLYILWKKKHCHDTCTNICLNGEICSRHEQQHI